MDAIWNLLTAPFVMFLLGVFVGLAVFAMVAGEDYDDEEGTTNESM
jgi:hypothetical protein